MSIDSVFKPIGPNTFVGTAGVQVCQRDGSGHVSYRVRNLAAAAQYLAWASTSAQATALAVAPSAGVVAPTCVGMLAGSVETFEIPPGVFFAASSATGFEIMSGEGA